MQILTARRLIEDHKSSTCYGEVKLSGRDERNGSQSAKKKKK